MESLISTVLFPAGLKIDLRDINIEKYSKYKYKGQVIMIKKGSSLVAAPNSDKKPDIQKLEKMFKNIIDIKERNKQILKAYEQGYSQHRIAKVLSIPQPAVNGVVKRNRK